MNTLNDQIAQLNAIRNQYGKQSGLKKIELLQAISMRLINSNYTLHAGKKALQLYYDTLVFIIAYPDNKTIYTSANKCIELLQSFIMANENRKVSVYNTGISGSSVCAAFSFEMVKWLRKTRPLEITLSSFELTNRQIQSILSVVMPKVESEILQDANAEWKGWLGRSLKKGENLLDKLIDVFDSNSIRPEVKDELWNAIGINVEINFTSHCSLPGRLIIPYYHHNLIRKNIKQKLPVLQPVRLQINNTEAEQIIDCSRMILVRHLREIDPISFTAAGLVAYYHLPRGISVALMGMVAERRHPIDSYMGYVVFKNGLPVGYAACWILFDSGRIGLNIFPGYRGGESQYIFEQVLQLHSKVYGLKRFSVDPYQLGKENSDGIQSGAFWVYYHAGFSPVLKALQELAAAEALKIKTTAGYRSSQSVLAKLANGRMQLLLHKNAVKFDATDISLAWAAILIKKYNDNRRNAEKDSVKKLAGILQIKNYPEANMNFILKNWCLLLLSNEKELNSNTSLKRILKKLFVLKASGSEEEYIQTLQQAAVVRNFIEFTLVKAGIQLQGNAD